jgi:hypothetical protein
METKQLKLNLQGEEYIFNLIPKKEIRKEPKRRVTLGMALEGISQLIEKKGRLENKLQKGIRLKDGIKIGTFNEEYRDYPIEDCRENVLKLNLKNKQIIIYEYFDDSRGIKNATIRTKSHWYDKWKKERIKDKDISIERKKI